MTLVGDVLLFLEQFAPPALAADWTTSACCWAIGRAVRRSYDVPHRDGRRGDEAIADEVDLIVAHHPLPFRAVKAINTDSYTGGLLWRLASAGVSVYSPHTAFDSAADGINARLAAGLGLTDVEPLERSPPRAMRASASAAAADARRRNSGTSFSAPSSS